MSRRAYAFLPDEPGDPMRFAVSSGGVWRVADARELRLGKDDDIRIFAPALDVAMLAAPIPARSDAQARRAAVYAIEDDLAEQADAVHAAIGRASAPGGDRWVAAVTKSVMNDWLSALSSRGFGQASLIAPQSALPAGPAAIETPGAILISAADKRMAVDAALQNDVLGLLLGEAAIQRAASADEALSSLAAMAEASPDLIDLRQGAYARRSQFDTSGFRLWRPTAALAATLAIVWGVSTVMETRALNEESRRLRAAAADLYVAAFPDERRPTDPASAMRRQLNDAPGARLDFLNAAAVLYGAVDAVEGAEVQSLRFNAETASLTASLAYRDYGDDAKVLAEAEAGGARARIGDARQAGGRVVGDIVLEPPQ
ncbi:MAG: type II secretion system protein GspL [Pseudomonadota bacterium]